jgi:hypothetical protein
MTWQHAMYSLMDWIFPVAEPLSQEEREKPQERLQELKTGLPQLSEQLLNEYCAVAQSLLDNEHERKQGIDARLTSILGMSSIAGSVGIAGLFLGTGGLSHIQSRSLRWLVTAVGCYLILQISAAMLNAVRGLSRRGYLEFSLLDFLPTLGEPHAAFLRRKAESILEVLSDHELQNNEKLTQLARAHCALRNFLCGLLVFTALGAVSMFRAGNDDDLVDRLKKNHDTYESLRGPQGIAGPKGDPGLPASVPLPCTPPAKTGGHHPKSAPKTGHTITDLTPQS